MNSDACGGLRQRILLLPDILTQTETRFATSLIAETAIANTKITNAIAEITIANTKITNAVAEIAIAIAKSINAIAKITIAVAKSINVIAKSINVIASILFLPETGSGRSQNQYIVCSQVKNTHPRGSFIGRNTSFVMKFYTFL
ncbi:hypothetical protein CDG76_09020 [Nostoc sp. 'Peltigera membranacea cyanobiont' 210A]|uniref:hypothetical protein n=1 Tax=Nostoc sp. 'Peltigera membranacea cyanobiont' 210A TaxID=2014529 RepID=UPI000B950739|nr:hypothetical protein [Nostoc sp. 'Peltigera membranacea cyanobiont' 210A]OYD96883.1 hypothetical protein CDG76_09020 [Nostoc sp. 'Peltigera membranacea cyanobiont' 210A]